MNYYSCDKLRTEFIVHLIYLFITGIRLYLCVYICINVNYHKDCSLSSQLHMQFLIRLTDGRQKL